MALTLPLPYACGLRHLPGDDTSDIALCVYCCVFFFFFFLCGILKVVLWDRGVFRARTRDTYLHGNIWEGLGRVL